MKRLIILLLHAIILVILLALLKVLLDNSKIEFAPAKVEDFSIVDDRTDPTKSVVIVHRDDGPDVHYIVPKDDMKDDKFAEEFINQVIEDLEQESK